MPDAGWFTFSLVSRLQSPRFRLPRYAPTNPAYSFWLPGQFGSLAAAPGVPGWAMATVYYHTTVSASGLSPPPGKLGRKISGERQRQLERKRARPSRCRDAEPVLHLRDAGARRTIELGAVGAFGRVAANVDGTLTTVAGPIVATRTGSIGDSLTGIGDIYPMATLKWNAGVHNFMTYLTGDIPVGAYDSSRLSNLSIGHGAIDGGGGYTFFNPQTGHEFSLVSGFTYNFKNPDTQYQNGIDFHFDWGMSQFLSKQVFVGMVGYGYQQITDDFGASPILGGFRSRVFGIGPQFGYLFPVGGMQGYLNLKAYGDFAAENRAAGWNAWLTFSISPAAPSSTVATRRVTK